MSQNILGYTIQKTLFSNGRTLVQRAIREADNGSVILKRIESVHPSFGQLQRFLFCYDVAKRFDHPNIVKVIDYIEEGHEPVMVIEDSHSVDLHQYVKGFPSNQLTLERFLAIATQLAEALSVIHHEQVIHKDLHPGNILINPKSGQVTIIDFGLASLLSREQPSLVLPEKLEGVLSYISPEQTGRMNRALDYRTDFYTLGVTFYELLTGQLPFSADDALGMVHAHIAKKHLPAVSLRPALPDIVSDIIDKLLSKTAEERYQSAQGLKKDIERCQHALASDDLLKRFPLGVDDISDRFQLPQKLYGREAETNTLMRCFFQAAEGTPRLLSVSGYSGIGKSALVHEVHKPIAAQNGLFISGKFDQFQYNVPYSAFSQALKVWLQYSLSQSETKLQQTRRLLNKGLGLNARVLIDFMGDFKPLLGELPEVPTLGAKEAQNRFHRVFVQLISLIAQERPLVIFIDDIQWADRGTLNLLSVLMSEADCNLLLIVAYRDNEVDGAHPALRMLKSMEVTRPGCTDSLRLRPLTTGEVSHILADGLRRSVLQVKPLAKLVHKKTGGNPFFVNEFLKTLYSEELLNFSLKQRCWIWDLQAIIAKGITDNVVDLMLGKMKLLPQQTQDILQLASCIGSQFDLNLLAVVAEQPLEEVTLSLWPALKEGLLLQEGGEWVPGADCTQGGEYGSYLSPALHQCQFLHDRMLQAAYESMDLLQRQQIHIKIGRLLKVLYLTPETPVEVGATPSLFTIVEQLNNGRSLMIDPAELLQLAELNAKAAMQAKSAGVWDAVVQYADVAIGLLPDNSWTTDYSLTFSIMKLKAEAEYLSGRPEVSSQFYDELLSRTSDDFVRAEICATRLVESIGRARWQDAIKLGVQGLGYLGITFPSDSSSITSSLLQARKQYDENAVNDAINRLSELPEMNDPRLLMAMQILPNLSACAYLTGNTELMELSALWGLNFIVESGLSDVTAIQLIWYAVLLAHENRYEQALEIGYKTITFLEGSRYSRDLASCYNGLAGLVLFVKEPYNRCIELHQKGYEIGLEHGEIARAVISYCNTLFLKLAKGEHLQTVLESAGTASAMCQRTSVFSAVPNNIERLSKALLEPSEEASHALDKEAFEQGYLDRIKGSLHEFNLLLYRSQLAFWYGDPQKAYLIAKRIHDKQVNNSRFCCFLDHLIQYGVLLCSHGDFTQPEVAEDFFNCLSVLRRFSDISPQNSGHKYQLLLAEQGRYQNGSMEGVARHYKLAIESAKDNGFIQYQALGNELFGAYWLSKGLESAATAYLEEAVYLYRSWGCQARVDYLKKEYRQWLGLGLQEVGSATGSESQGSSTSQPQTDSHTHSLSLDKSGLDFDSIMKSAQVISSELKLTKLAVKVMQVLAENAGAQTAALVLDSENGPKVEAMVSSQSESSNFIDAKSQPLDQCSLLPVNIIRYVLRTDETLNLPDVAGEKAFDDDPYLLAQPPKSILCVPVDYRDKIIGVLYLENRLTTHAFTKSRLSIIKMLLSQASISIENARLFAEINALNSGLEEKVEERTQQLNESNRALVLANEELKSFSYSVSHDLRAPLRSIKGFSQILLDDYADVLGEMGGDLVTRIMAGTHKMSDLINGLLELSRVQRSDLQLKTVNLSDMARTIAEELNETAVDHPVKYHIVDGISVQGDERMLYSVMENLLNNAWKYSSKADKPEVWFDEDHTKGRRVFRVKDNGAGFDMAHANNLFGTFQRLHLDHEYPGTGIGLATVKRIITKHGGDIWAEAEMGKGAIFYFTL